MKLDVSFDGFAPHDEALAFARKAVAAGACADRRRPPPRSDSLDSLCRDDHTM